MSTAIQVNMEELKKAIASLHPFFLKEGDVTSTKKLEQLGKKLYDREFSIALCGHFSAGKSSMINKIIGENLLPSSPIPTSANLVKVKRGEEYAKVWFKEGNPRLYKAPYDFEVVKSHCKDGDAIEEIEISHQTNSLPKNACIFDTPGIDSTDDAHRMATESALHLADVILYVMDYNHVQSEVNFLFTKELQDRGKEVYLVINQIDKHREEELTFEQFKNGVIQSFAQWGVKPVGIFYTSLKEEQLVHNDFPKLQSFIQQKLGEKDALLPQSIYHSLEKIVAEHRHYLEEKYKEKSERYEQTLAHLTEEERRGIVNDFHNLKIELEKIDSFLYEREKQFDEGLENILKNAYLMPFETRDLAEKYLQSTDNDFKVGFFFAKKKTLEERSRRLDAFLGNFKEKVEAQLDWHLKEYFSNILKQDDIYADTILEKIQSFSVPVTKELLEGALKTGAKVSGDYVLNYTGDVADRVKKIARNEANQIKEPYISTLREKVDRKRSDLQNQFDEKQELYTAWQQLEKIHEEKEALFSALNDRLNGNVYDEKFIQTFEDIITVNEEVEIIEDSLSLKEEEKIDQLVQHEVQKQEKQTEELEAFSLEETVNQLKEAANLLKPLPGFRKIAEDLNEKGERLNDKGFTVALFGAFSAGKSSFANALIGEKILPVSPNPTTAAINQIKPVEESHPHGMVVVHVKEKQVLLEDVNQSLAPFDKEGKDLNEAFRHVENIFNQIDDVEDHDKTHLAFLKAFKEGFHQFAHQLGEKIITDVNQFQPYVAEEQKSCFVEMIEVYYDCELTKKGITLVDTPGADSINSRHTGVAFDYIKNSDAILFVTYYNHAFSKADREFLIQLGRVKDTFELDKMFFIVNAVDLANNEEEKQQVLDYVKDQLLQYGIRFPTLYPVSSLLALEEKLEGKADTSGFKTFEENFFRFISSDLTKLAITSAKIELNRAHHQLRSFIQSAKEDKDLKNRKIVQFQQNEERIEEEINNASMNVMKEKLNQEIDELTYYIKERVFFRFNDFFRESFNPSLLKDDGRNIKNALHKALRQLLNDFGFDFAQELRATTLRVETFMKKLFKEQLYAIGKEVEAIEGELTFSDFELPSFEGIEFQSAFVDLDLQSFNKVLSLFKSPKAFFEQKGSKVMGDRLYELLQTEADLYLQTEKIRLKEYYFLKLDESFNLLKEHLHEQSKEYYEGMYAALKNEIPIDQLIEIEKRIRIE